MKQHEAVIQALENLGGIATLGQLYQAVPKIKECEWKTKTPNTSIRRIVQSRKELFVRIRPGLWALRSYQDTLNLTIETKENQNQPDVVNQGHAYYQGLLLIIGKLRHYNTFVPHQDKNNRFINTPLHELKTVDAMPEFSYDWLVKRCSTVDVIWFNQRRMPHSLFEVEHSTDMQNSLLKFHDLQDFYTRMVIVAHENRKSQFQQKINLSSFEAIKKRVSFLSYNNLVKQYEAEIEKQKHEFVL